MNILFLPHLEPSSEVLFILFMVVCPQEMLNEARERLATIAKDPARYPALMDGLILQVCGSTTAGQT